MKSSMLLLVLMNQFTPVRGETGGERFGCNMVESVGLRWVFSFLFLWSYLPADPLFQLFYQGKEGVFLVFGFFFYLGWDGKSVFVFFSSCFYACMHGVFIDILPLSSSCSYSPFFCPFPFPYILEMCFIHFFQPFHTVLPIHIPTVSSSSPLSLPNWHQLPFLPTYPPSNLTQEVTKSCGLQDFPHIFALFPGFGFVCSPRRLGDPCAFWHTSCFVLLCYFVSS